MLPATARTSLTLPDLEPAGTTYEVQVRALTASRLKAPASWSDTGSGTSQPAAAACSILANNGRVTTFLVIPTFSVIRSEKSTSAWPIELYYSDPDGDTLRWGVSSQYPGIARH